MKFLMLLVVMFAMVSLAFEDVVFSEALMSRSFMKHNETEVFRTFVAVIETDLMPYFPLS